MFGKVVFKLCSFGISLGIVSMYGYSTMLHDASALLNVLSDNAKPSRTLTSKNCPELSPVSIDQNAITQHITGHDINGFLQGVIWKDDQSITQTFNERYKNALLETCWYLPAEKGTIVIVDEDHYSARVESLMQHCREEYRKKLLAMEIIADNSKISEFVSAILSGATCDFATFLGVPDCSGVFTSLNLKLNSEQVLSGEKENLTLAELSKPERRLMLTLFTLNKLSKTGNPEAVAALQTVKSLAASIDFADFVKSCCDLNPYYPSIQRVGVTGLSFSDYDRFFNYESLSDISTVLHILRHLNSTTTFGSIGVIIDNLKSFINDFVSSGFDKENPELFAKFADLKSKFPSME